ncbi:MAG: SGNH/GDSL hydrolase family protein [Acholeplasma sp.]|nr:SGNH/GDSL hydrolase family protein [Acholeplasma sp.]
MNKITIIGDSLLKGVVYDETIHRHKVLKNSGINQLVTNGFEIDNMAKFGLTIDKASKLIKEEVLSKNQKVLIEIGGNDCDYNWDDVSLDPYKPHQTKTPLSQFETSLEALISYLLERDVQPVLVSIPPLDDRLFFDFISKNRDKNSIMAFLGETKKIYYHQQQYNDVIKKVSDKYQTAYIPLRETIESFGNLKSLYCLDGMHLNELGQTIIFETIKKYLTQ